MTLGLPFWKLEGAGNDFVFVEWSALSRLPQLDLTSGGDFEPHLISPGLSDLARWVCDRTTGLGADGLVVWHLPESEKRSSEWADVRAYWCIVNADGSFAETCGNAARCMGLLLHKEGWWTGKSQLTLTSLVGHAAQEHNTSVSALEVAQNGLMGQARVSFGPAQNVWEPTGPETGDGSASGWLAQLNAAPTLSEWGLQLKKVVCVQLSNPHIVFLVSAAKQSQENSKIYKMCGDFLQQQCAKDLLGSFPLANIGFMEGPLAQNEWNLTVYERGAGLTQACGSGTVAASYALGHWGTLNEGTQSIAFALPGGRMSVEATEGRDAKSIPEKMTQGDLRNPKCARALVGPTRIVARGELA